MKLVRLELHSFRAFDHATVDFPESGVLLVAGANNSGKSALLSALDSIAGGGSFGEMQHYGSATPARVTASFRLDDQERDSLLWDASDRSLEESIALREVHWDFASIDQGGLTPVRISTEWPSHETLTLIDIIVTGDNASLRVNPVHALLTTVKNSSPNYEPQEVAQFAVGSDGIRTSGSLGVFRPLVDYFLKWTSGIYHFKALRPGTGTDVHPLSSSTRLDPTGSDLASVLNHLYHNQRDTYEALNNLLQEIVPGIGQLRLPLEGGSMRIAFSDPSAPKRVLNLKNLGTGVEQLLMTLVVGLMDDGPSGIIIEEPETNLHPGAQRALMALVREWSTTKPFIVATHSPVFLDASHRSDVLLVTRHAGTSEVRSLGSETLDALDELGVRLSDVLSADRLLLVEGPTDEAVLETWFPEHLRNPRVAVIQAGGGDSARYAGHLRSWLARADRLGDRRVLFLRDRDELPDAQIRKLEDGGYVKVPLRRELENYLLDAAALAAVLSERRHANITPEEVASVINIVADELKQTVVLKRVCRDLALIRLMDNQLRKDLAKTQAGLEELQEAVVGRIGSIDEVKATIGAFWVTAEKDVAERWDTDMLALAPGEEVLKAVWQHFGLSGYSKAGDGQLIAAKMIDGPAELLAILEQFIAD